ncbi:N-acetyltransferase [Leuconostoc carnosum]|uniref:N-acetyltransferase n=1 Tax=Leuconostoc carnosum TaxID=1252 RepID=A0AAE6M3A9_LEUCA|nr:MULTISPECIES: GNAT family N-acetyltransferase [Leuconostoc]KAA8327238.1 N-acetyltransferase [Leuconostoc carnosum]KAA8332380.1 N-acetyltransferase [Leuconostoc carnosum]KAA8364327.1 N-acetyltransferase [Leuconostoc carnosum]KAA8367220.1 N-acetyltransferase [Leuconostoc carnosum]KAA8369598.1 N-acetyltransferase [Leuconostoc carnosum]
MTTFQHEPGRYFLLDGDKTIAEILYTTVNDGKTYAINSTVVDSSLRGQGIARQLVDAVVHEAHEEQMTIKPVCPYVRELFARNPDQYQEIQYKS